MPQGGVQLRCRAQIDPDAERIFKCELQADNVEQGSAFCHVHQQIEVASLSINASRYRAEHAHAARATRCCEGEQVVALRGKRFGRSHERSFAGIDRADEVR